MKITDERLAELLAFGPVRRRRPSPISWEEQDALISELRASRKQAEAVRVLARERLAYTSKQAARRRESGDKYDAARKHHRSCMATTDTTLARLNLTVAGLAEGEGT